MTAWTAWTYVKSSAFGRYRSRVESDDTVTVETQFIDEPTHQWRGAYKYTVTRETFDAFERDGAASWGRALNVHLKSNAIATVRVRDGESL